MHSSSEIHASFELGETSIHSFPAMRYSGSARIQHKSRILFGQQDQGLIISATSWLDDRPASPAGERCCSAKAVRVEGSCRARTDFHHGAPLLAFLSALLGLAPAAHPPLALVLVAKGRQLATQGAVHALCAALLTPP